MLCWCVPLAFVYTGLLNVTFTLKCNSCDTESSILRKTIQWHLHIQNVQSSPPSSSQYFHHSSVWLVSIFRHFPLPLSTFCLCEIVSPFLYEWSHTLFVFLCLTSFIYYDVWRFIHVSQLHSFLWVNKIPSIYMHVYVCIWIYINAYIYPYTHPHIHPHICIFSQLDGYLGYFCLLASMNGATMSIYTPEKQVLQ